MKIAWWKRKENWGAALTSLSSVLVLFNEKTAAYKIGVVLGVGLTALGLSKGYKADNLPSGITGVMDKIPNSITGVKGEKK
jgi:hypothetical protein